MLRINLSDEDVNAIIKMDNNCIKLYNFFFEQPLFPSDEREMRIKSKIIKVKSFVENIVRGRNDLNESCLKLFDFKVEEIEERYKVKARAELVF